MSIGYLVLLLPAIFALKPPPVMIASAEEIRSSDDNQWNMPHRISITWLSAAGLFCCICMAVPIIHLVPLATDLKLKPETATALLLVMMISGTFGRLFFGSLADRIGALYTYFIASAAQTAVVFWFTQTAYLPALIYTFHTIRFRFFRRHDIADRMCTRSNTLAHHGLWRGLRHHHGLDRYGVGKFPGRLLL